jgi:cellulose synthase (UDP-forming)
MSHHSIKSIHHPEFDKNHYIIKHPWIMKSVYLFGIISWLITFVAYFNFFNLDLLYWAVFFPLISGLTAYYVISYAINLYYKKPDLEEHQKLTDNFIQSDNKPTVDIHLPVCGEPLELLRRTWEAVSKLDYENYNVYVLDDKGNEAVEKMAQEFNFIYFSRPNKGEMKKAGNLKYAFERSHGDYIIIFDADFAPLPEFINESVPYLIRDPKIGILQTPQYFEVHENVGHRSWLEFGAGAIQENFYRLIQVSRDQLGGAICVGTCAIYRRSALAKIGGAHQIEHSEDVWTGIKINGAGYTVRYNPIILAQGFCPDDSESFFKQQYRWCKGSMSLMVDPNFWKLNIPISAKMCFISGFLYYITSFFDYITAFIGTILILNYSDRLNWVYSIPFIPYFIFIYILTPLIRIHGFSIGNTISRLLAHSAYTLSLYHSLFDWNMGWSPTGVKTKRDFWITFSFFFNLAYFIFYIGTIFYVLAQGKISLFNFNHYIPLLWIFINIFSFIVFLITMGHDMYIKHQFPKFNFKPSNHDKKTFYKILPIVIAMLIINVFTAFSSDPNSNVIESKQAQAQDVVMISHSSSSTISSLRSQK